MQFLFLPSPYKINPLRVFPSSIASVLTLTPMSHKYNVLGSKNSVCFNNSRAGSENSDSCEASARVRPLHEATAAQHRDVAQYDRGTYEILVLWKVLWRNIWCRLHKFVQAQHNTRGNKCMLNDEVLFPRYVFRVLGKNLAEGGAGVPNRWSHTYLRSKGQDTLKEQLPKKHFLRNISPGRYMPLFFQCGLTLIPGVLWLSESCYKKDVV